MKPVAFFRFFIGRVKSFGRTESGVTLPLVAFSMIALIGFVGLAIDVARTQMVQSRLQFALDAASLAAGSTVSTDNLISEANKYLNVNFNGYLGARLLSQDTEGNGVKQNKNSNNSTTKIGLFAQASVPTTFMQVLGVSSVTVDANSTISRRIAGLEVTMVIDVSYGDDLDEFKSGLAGFVNDLFLSAPGASGNLYVSIVPFNQTVNIGTQNASWTNPPTAPAYLTSGWGPENSWGGCVDGRLGNGTDMHGSSAPKAALDDPPSVAPFIQYYYPSDNATTIQRKLGISASEAAAEYADNTGDSTGWNALNADGLSNPFGQPWDGSGGHYMGLNIWYNPSLPPANKFVSPLNVRGLQGPNFMCSTPIVALTNSSASVLNAIDSIQWVRGDWLPDMGLEWGWNTLSPRWQGLWGNLVDSQGNQIPHNYDTTGWNKVLVWVEGIGSASYPWVSYNYIDDGIRGAYGYLSDNELGQNEAPTSINDGTAMGTADNTLQNNLSSVCTYMKNPTGGKGVLIFTLGYSPDGTVGGLPGFMVNCASGSQYIYWFANHDWSQFDTALNSIAASITKLWLSE